MSEETKRGRFADLVDAIHKWWSKRGEGEEAEDESRRGVDEEITRMLPEPVNGSKAVDAARRRKKQIDDALAAAED